LAEGEIDLAAQRIGVQCRELALDAQPHVTLGWVLWRIERLDPEFTFAVRVGRMVPKLPREFVGAGDFTNAPV
jgi:hypothetical protein